MRRTAIFLALTLCLTQAGCISVPYPHKVVPHARISGRVIDSNTSKPICNMRIKLAGKTRGRTGQDGTFDLQPKEEWRFFCNVPLLPVEFWWLGGDTVTFTDHDPDRWQKRDIYRQASLEVYSWPVPTLMAYSRKENLSIHDDLGDVPLRKHMQGFRR